MRPELRTEAAPPMLGSAASSASGFDRPAWMGPLTCALLLGFTTLLWSTGSVARCVRAHALTRIRRDRTDAPAPTTGAAWLGTWARWNLGSGRGLGSSAWLWQRRPALSVLAPVEPPRADDARSPQPPGRGQGRRKSAFVSGGVHPRRVTPATMASRRARNIPWDCRCSRRSCRRVDDPA